MVCRVISVLDDLGVCCRRLAVASVGLLEVVLLLGLVFDRNR
jgi:DNA-directed RNA polymerase subunit N (RpoN/RPB10)